MNNEYDSVEDCSVVDHHKSKLFVSWIYTR